MCSTPWLPTWCSPVDSHTGRSRGRTTLTWEGTFFLIDKLCRSQPLHSAVRDYLGVRTEHLNIPGKSDTGGEKWLRRPLEGEEELLLAAGRETMYLLELSHILQVGLELPVRRVTEIIMQTAVEEESQPISSHIVPQAMNNLPLSLW